MIREYDKEAPTREEAETATFALGYFWGPEAQFDDVGFVRVYLHHLGEGTVAFIEFMERAVLPEFY